MPRAAGHRRFQTTERRMLVFHDVKQPRAVARMSEAKSGVPQREGWSPHVAEPVIGPRFARTRWLMRATNLFF